MTLINYVLGRQCGWSKCLFFFLDNLSHYYPFLKWQVIVFVSLSLILFNANVTFSLFIFFFVFFKKWFMLLIATTIIYYNCTTSFLLSSCMLPIHFTLVYRNSVCIYIYNIENAKDPILYVFLPQMNETSNYHIRIKTKEFLK